MLDTETKSRIDSARDILVGKVPDPKSQVEQITIALIYKFMDDMDRQTEEIGGKATFFSGPFKKYAWSHLLDNRIGGHERLLLYAEGIEKMNENKNIPQLFRDIFKGVFLPYRDPETLNLFLKEINSFSYEHSEKLGDAFEYLLSVMDSQGDAGQFRTPRHLIDFIVSIVDPKKNETILDPACGSAGFLISSYKHILQVNSKSKPGDKLTADEKGMLVKNVMGYDISPDMVRLSRVNMYLHGFANPRINEYDTLTSEERWDERFDVILANPPFMSPKGGIRPHNRFSIQAKRSEVLFVDYIAEHLTSTGRAGIIVPEGIIFQSQNSYKDLRKMLVKNYLVAVISLPAGVFNPYSGVKTSILILDKSIAKKSNTIGFFKIENDGYGLGAQRREIDKNDLPQIHAEVNEYLRSLKSGQSAQEIAPVLGLIVNKEKIASNEYNLSGERYREGPVGLSAWPIVPVGNVFFKSDESVLPETISNAVTYIGLENITKDTGKISGETITEKTSDIKSTKNIFKAGDILYGKLRPNLNKVWVADRSGICSTDILVIRPIENRVLPELYGHIFRSPLFNNAVLGQIKGAQLPRIGWASFEKLQIPIPSLEVQKEIVTEIEGYQKVIDGARAVLDNYRPHIPIHPDWPFVKLEDLCSDFQNGANFSKEQMGRGVKFVNIKDLFSTGYVDLEKLERVELTEIEIERKKLKSDDLLFVRSSVKEEGVGFPSLMENSDEPVVFCGFIIKCSPNKDVVLPAYLLHLLRSTEYREKVISLSNRANITNIGQDSLKSLLIPLPPIDTQRKIVTEIEAEQALVASSRELINRFEIKIKSTLDRVWGEGNTPKE